MKTQYNSNSSRDLKRATRYLIFWASLCLISIAGWSGARAQSHYGLWIDEYVSLNVWEKAPYADPDNDRVPNIGEQLLALDPTIPLSEDPKRTNAPAMLRDALGDLRYRFRVDPAVEGWGEVRHQTETSTNLQEWSVVEPESVGGLYSVPATPAADREFYRTQFSYHPPNLNPPRPTFSARGEERLGGFLTNPDLPWNFSDAANGDWRAHRNNRWCDIRGGMQKKIAANFLIEGDRVPVAILISAEAYVEDPKKRMFVRLLVDGVPMQPDDVVFCNGGASQPRAARSFEFFQVYDRGLHTVEAQWMMDDGASGFIRDAAILIRQGDTEESRGKLAGVTPESGLNRETASTQWQDAPGLEQMIHTVTDRDILTATVSAESYASAGDNAWIRVLIDGVVADPGPVRFAQGGFQGSRTMAFGRSDLAPGEHNVRVQWKADAGGTAGLGDRTLVLSVGTSANTAPVRKYFLSANNPINAPPGFDTVANLSKTFVPLPPDTDVSVIFTAEFPNGAAGSVSARLSIGGVPVAESEVLLTDGDANPGVHSFTFDAKHLGALLETVQITDVTVEWMSEANPAPVMGARSMVLYVKQHDVPDLAEPPNLGIFPVEPTFGERHVLVILFDPQRPGHPAPSIANLDSGFFGASNSVADYYQEVSGGRLTIKKAGILGPYVADHPSNHYWNGPGDHQDKWAEAVIKANADFDFSQYDFDGDGYLSAWNELAIFIVVPQSNPAGFVRNLWSGAIPQALDGVYLDLITEWYTSDAVDDYWVATHEFAHQVLSLADLYKKSNANPSVGTQPGAYCLMDQGNYAIAQHMNPAYKLALGWVTPRIVEQDSAVSLQDVKVSREVVVLPREPGRDADEYLVLENRPAPSNNTRYDFGLPDSGIAVWHIVQSTIDSVNPPSCLGQAAWDAQTSGDNPRRGIRLVRPGISYNNLVSLWNSNDYDLDEFGLVCPNPGPAHNILVWSDGSPSYELHNFPAAGSFMDINVFAP